SVPFLRGLTALRCGSRCCTVTEVYSEKTEWKLRSSRRLNSQTVCDIPDPFRIYKLLDGQKIYRCLEIFWIDIRRGNIPRIPIAFPRERRVKGNRQKPSFRHGLGVQTGRLLFNCAERAADRDDREF